MSRLMGRQAGLLTPYVPGEQPQDKRYIKLNTNECPYPPAPGVRQVMARDTGHLRLYPDPDVRELREAAAEAYGLSADQVFAGNGSDEVLAFAFMAFFDRGDPVCYPDISYGFYPVYAGLFGLEGREIPLGDGFILNPADYHGLDGGIFIANPNAPTGLCLSLPEVEGIVRSNPDQLVVIDEAYVDFGGQSAVPLIDRYDNLLVVQTFSKSRSMAGMRLGLALGNRELIQALNRIKFSFNSYNVNRITAAAGTEAVRDRAYLRETVGKVVRTREAAKNSLRALGFQVTESQANFLFARHPAIRGRELYLALKERGILVRHFAKDRIDDYVRITIGADSEMEALLKTIQNLIQEKGAAL